MSSSKRYPEVEKPPLDKREYRGIEMSNKMKVLLVSDPLTDKSAASLSVAVGSMSSPKELPGLAHFCEHMLFLGTKKYEAENEYFEYITEHAGYSNAYTADDTTNYYFDVDPKSLRPALDRFSQFFICPLFTESATEREVNAVHAEHESNINDDTWRANQIEISTSNPKHPYCHFGTGNRETLWDIPRSQNIDVRTALMDFHRSYYSANLMCLCVFGSESLDELQEMAEEMFLAVENRNVKIPRWPESPYSKEFLGVRKEVVPIEDLKRLQITFPFPDTTLCYKDARGNYLSHLIGHEGPGSILSLLKSKNWANSLLCGSYNPARGFGTFDIFMSLTPEGLQNIDEIILHIFQYLKMLSERGPQKWIWEEMRDISAIMFRFQDKEEPQSLVSRMASAMHVIPVNEVMSSGYVLTDYDAESIQYLLNLLTPENCRISIFSQDFAETTTNTEKYYGIRYNLKRIDEDVIKKWKSCGTHPELSLPPKNEFIPSEFDLKPREPNNGIIPTMIDIGRFQKLWFLQDNEFELPKASIVIEMYSNLVLFDPLYFNLMELLARCIEDELTEYSYPANLAGLNNKIDRTFYGLEIYINGYDHKLPSMVKKVFECILNFEPNCKRFEVLKEYYARGLKNWEQIQPYDHVNYYLVNLLDEKRWNRDEMISALEGATLEALISFTGTLISKTKLQWVACGNLTLQETKDMVTDVESMFAIKGFQVLLPSQVVRVREVNLRSGVNYLYSKEHPTHRSSCTAVLFQIGLQNTRAKVILELITLMFVEPCFDQLRNQEQLGYHVYTYVRKSNDTQGLLIIIQSERHPTFVETRIDDFMRNFENSLKDMSEEKFLSWRNSLYVDKSEKFKKLGDRFDLILDEINSQQYNFDRQNVELKELETVSLEEITEFYTRYMGANSESKKRLSIYALSKTKWIDSQEDSDELADSTKPQYAQEPIINVDEWKKTQSLYPCGRPHISDLI